MSAYVHSSVSNGIGFIVLDRPKALNSLSLEMVRDITRALLQWKDDRSVDAVVIRSSSEKAFCAGGDIRFFHDVGKATPQQAAYWENVFARVVESAEWKKMLERDVMESHFLRGAQTRAFLNTEYEELKAVLGDLGLVK